MTGDPIVSPTTVRRERVGVAVGLIVVVVTIALSFGGVWLWFHNAHNACERMVQGRENGRTMFEYFITIAPDPNAPEVVAFSDELDRRLPHLHCVGWFDTKPVPVEGP